MSRVVYRYMPMGKGIEFIEVRDTSASTNRTHVVRVEVSKATPFFIGSYFRPPYHLRSNDVIPKSTLNSVSALAARGAFNTSLFGKKLIPKWISNSTFFSDDCYDFRGGRPYPEIAQSAITGSIVHRAKPVVDCVHSPKVTKRWVFFQKASALPLQFGIVQQNGYTSANAFVSSGYYTAIAGGACLVAKGKPYGAGPKANGLSKFWQASKYGSFNDQNYCCGPIIAINSTSTVIYLIMDRTNLNNHPDPFNQGMPWEDMANYLTTTFLSDIRRTRDGAVWDAIVYDGGGSRGLWVPGYSKSGIVDGYYGLRPIPLYLCLWA